MLSDCAAHTLQVFEMVRASKRQRPDIFTYGVVLTAIKSAEQWHMAGWLMEVYCAHPSGLHLTACIKILIAKLTTTNRRPTGSGRSASS